jgi:hypothetical protein
MTISHLCGLIGFLVMVVGLVNLINSCTFWHVFVPLFVTHYLVITVLDLAVPETVVRVEVLLLVAVVCLTHLFILVIISKIITWRLWTCIFIVDIAYLSNFLCNSYGLISLRFEEGLVCLLFEIIAVGWLRLALVDWCVSKRVFAFQTSYVDIPVLALVKAFWPNFNVDELFVAEFVFYINILIH